MTEIRFYHLQRARLEVPFGDYGISQPRAAAVLSVDDKGTMEVQLFFTRTT